MATTVMCRVCRQRFVPNREDKDTYWILPSRNWYYHKKCYEDWKKVDLESDAQWEELIFDLIVREIKGDYSYHQIRNQITKFVGQRMTKKGIYFTLYWYLIVKKNKWESKYGIGIVPTVYDQATTYWIDRESKAEGIMKQIETLAITKVDIEVSARKGTRRKKDILAPE